MVSYAVAFVVWLMMLSCGTFTKISQVDLQTQSIFTRYSAQKCSLLNKEKEIVENIECSRMKHYLNLNSAHCQSSKNIFWGKFPEKSRLMYLCRNVFNLSLDHEKTIRFLVFGDAGKGENKKKGYFQRSVAKMMAMVCPHRSKDSENGCDFAMVPGDIIYPKGVRSVWDNNFYQLFEEIYQDLFPMPFFLVPGNHDYGGSIIAQEEYSLFSGLWRMPYRFYAFMGLPSWVRIVAIDTERLKNVSASDPLTDEQFDNFKKLCETDGWRIAFGHYPIMSFGHHGSHPHTTDILHKWRQSCPFNLYVAGHDHHQEHIQIDQFDTFVQGAGGTKVRPVNFQKEKGQSPNPEAGLVNVTQHFAASENGFAVITLTPAEMEAKFYSIKSLAISDQLPTPIYTCRAQLEKEQKTCQPFP